LSLGFVCVLENNLAAVNVSPTFRYINKLQKQVLN